MKAIIVKNDNFETIGFNITSNGQSILSWGISPELKSNFQKEIDVNQWMVQIFELVRLEATMHEKERFVSNFFRVACDQKIVKDKQPVNFSKHDEELEQLKRKFNNIISNVK